MNSIISAAPDDKVCTPATWETSIKMSLHEMKHYSVTSGSKQEKNRVLNQIGQVLTTWKISKGENSPKPSTYKSMSSSVAHLPKYMFLKRYKNRKKSVLFGQ